MVITISDHDLPTWRGFYEVYRYGLHWYLQCPRCRQQFAMYVVPYRRTRDGRWRVRKHAEAHGTKIPARAPLGELVTVEGGLRRQARR